MKTKHTEGEIEAKLNKLTDEKGLCVAVATGPKAHENAERLALAWNLLPEFIETLQAVRRLDYFQEHGAIAEKVRAVLAKATKWE